MQLCYHIQFLLLNSCEFAVVETKPHHLVESYWCALVSLVQILLLCPMSPLSSPQYIPIQWLYTIVVGEIDQNDHKPIVGTNSMCVCVFVRVKFVYTVPLDIPK